MIFTAFLNVVYAFLLVLVSPFLLLPDVSLPVAFSNAVVNASSYLYSFDYFIPVTTLLIVFGIFLTYELAYFGIKLINWVIRKIPTIS